MLALINMEVERNTFSPTTSQKLLGLDSILHVRLHCLLALNVTGPLPRYPSMHTSDQLTRRDSNDLASLRKHCSRHGLFARTLAYAVSLTTWECVHHVIDHVTIERDNGINTT